MVYARAVGLKFFVFILIINMLHECSEVYLDVWISQWTNDHTASVNGTVDKGHNMRLVVYGAIGLVRGISYTVHYILICQSFNDHAILCPPHNVFDWMFLLISRRNN